MCDVRTEPLVSIVMPIYNAAQYLDASINSVRNQSYKRWELLLVDDCSTDDSYELAKKHADQDSRIKLLKLSKNQGAASARKRGIEEANGIYIAFLDSDDLWLKDKLMLQISYMQTHDCKFSCTSYFSIGEHESDRKFVFRPPQRISYSKALLYGNPIGNSTVVVLAEVLRQVKIPLIRKRNDYALWLLILKRGIVCQGFDRCLTVYRRRSDSLSSNKFSVLPYQWRLYRKEQRLNCLAAVFFMCTWCFSKLLKINRHDLSYASEEDSRALFDMLSVRHVHDYDSHYEQ